MSDYYTEQDSRAWKAHLDFEKDEKKKAEITAIHKARDEKAMAEKQKAIDERFTRMPGESEVFTDCPECGRFVPVFRFCDGIAKADYAPTCSMCGKEVPVILGAGVKEFVVEKIDYVEDEY